MEQQTAELETVTSTVTEGSETQADATTVEKPAPEVAQEKKDGEEQHRSRAYRRLDRWRQRAIAAEERERIYKEQLETKAKPAQVTTSDEPQRDQFSDYETYIEARASYRAEKAAEKKAQEILEKSKKASEQERTSNEQNSKLKVWNERVDKARDELEDFDEVCGESEAPLTKHMADAMFESDVGARITYYLAKNPDEAERISKLSPMKQAAAIFALEEKVSKPAKKPSKAPDPINPVGTKGDVQKDPAKMSQAEYNSWRNSGGR